MKDSDTNSETKRQPKATGWNRWIGELSLKAVVAELMAMTLFVYIGTGAATTFGATKGFDMSGNLGGLLYETDDVQSNVVRIEQNLRTNANWGVTTALAFGLAITVLAFATGHLSGGQINPCVTTGLFLSGALGLLQAVANMVAQVVGAILGSGLLYATLPNSSNSTLASNALAPGVTVGNAMCGEIVMTFVLVSVVLEVAGSKMSVIRSQAPLAIGFAVFCAHAVLLPIDGCSINPARSLGPAIVSGTWHDFWVFIVGPFSGCLLAVPVHYFFKTNWAKHGISYWRMAPNGGDPLQLQAAASLAAPAGMQPHITTGRPTSPEHQV